MPYERELTRQGRVEARLEHELALATRAIQGGLAEIDNGRNVRTELHNISAHVRNAETRVTPDPTVAAAGVALVRAATNLAVMAEWSCGLIGRGLYPPKLETAGAAVERWRAALMEAARR